MEPGGGVHHDLAAVGIASGPAGIGGRGPRLAIVKGGRRAALNRARQCAWRARQRASEPPTADAATVPVLTTGQHVTLLLRLTKVTEAEISAGDAAYDDAMARAIGELLDDLSEGRAVIRYL